MCAPLLAAYRMLLADGGGGGGKHALCKAHRLRELQALVACDEEDRARRLPRHLLRARRVARVARERGIAVPGRVLARIVRGCDRLLVEAMKRHEDRTPLPSRGRGGTPRRRKGHNLALRLHARRDETLRFLTDAPAPFANNEAERDLRMMKRRQKISGGFRSRRAADDFAILRSVIATAQKQRRDILKTPMGPPESFIQDIRYA